MAGAVRRPAGGPVTAASAGGVTRRTSPDDRRPSKSERAYDWLHERISARELAPGYRLVLATIADELGMSVVPVREAIRRLEAQGLVTFEPNVGAHVAMIDDSQYRHSMETLAVLEGAATALAARHLAAADLRRAREVNARLVATLDDFDPHAFTALNQEFHTVLFTPCPNPRVLELVTTEWSRLGRLRDSTFAFVPERARESVREHEGLIALIETGAPLGDIEQAARQHRSATLTAYLDHEHRGGHP